MASHDLQRLVAAQVALGASTAELAERFNYTPRGMRKLVASQAVRALVAEERAALAERLDGYRAHLVELGRQAIENVQRVLGDPHHPRNLETSRWLLDRIAYRPDAPHVDVQMNVVSSEVLQGLSDSLDRLAAARAVPVVPLDRDPHFIPAR